MSTKFQILDSRITDNQDDNALREPILATFPTRVQSHENLKDMKFTIKEQKKQKDPNNMFNFPGLNRNKRVIKSSYKHINYTATNFAPQTADRAQQQDFYLGVISPKHPQKVYMVPVQTPYQFTQEIQLFNDRFGVNEDNEAIKQMS